MQTFFGFDAQQSHMYMAGMIGIWKILNVVLFLIPAVAIHWEYRPKTQVRRLCRCATAACEAAETEDGAPLAPTKSKRQALIRFLKCDLRGRPPPDGAAPRPAQGDSRQARTTQTAPAVAAPLKCPFTAYDQSKNMTKKPPGGVANPSDPPPVLRHITAASWKSAGHATSLPFPSFVKFPLTFGPAV